jgi:ATP-dependent DNA ligase
MPLPFLCPDKPHEVGPEWLDELRPDEWLSQVKWDGWRCLSYIDAPGEVRMLSSGGRDFAETQNMERQRIIADMKRAIVALGLPSGTVLDSELAGPRGHHPWSLQVFDCLAWDGDWLRSTPYWDRWGLCRAAGERMPAGGYLHLCETVVGQANRPNAFLEHFQALKQDWIATGSGMHYAEGIVMKRLSGTLYLNPRSCVESPHLFKIKYRDIRDSRF